MTYTPPPLVLHEGDIKYNQRLQLNFFFINMQSVSILCQWTFFKHNID